MMIRMDVLQAVPKKVPPPPRNFVNFFSTNTKCHHIKLCTLISKLRLCFVLVLLQYSQNDKIMLVSFNVINIVLASNYEDNVSVTRT